MGCGLIYWMHRLGAKSNQERDSKRITIVMQTPCAIMSMYLDSLAARLILARTQLGLTQEEVAKRAGVAQGTIGNIESDQRRNPRELLAIAAAVGVRPEWLKDGKGPMQTAGTLAGAAQVGEADHQHIAHVVSHARTIVPPRTLVWEDLVIEDVKGQFVLAIADDALAPAYLPGQSGIWEAGDTAKPGQPVLLVAPDGTFHFRLFEPRGNANWAGISARAGYRELSAERDGVRVIARLRYLDLG